MTNYINIAKKGAQPLLIDADNVSVITETFEEREGKKKLNFSVSSLEKANVIYGETEGWNIDVDEAVKRLAKAGAELVCFPYVWGDKEVGRVWVNPKAFNYVATSAPVVPDGKTEEHVAMLMGVNGHWLVETYAVPVKDLEKFLDQVKQERPGIKRIDPETASTRFYQPGFAMYDPDKIIRVYYNGYQVNVKYESGGELDFDMPRTDWPNFYLDKKVNRASPDKKQAWYDKQQHQTKEEADAYYQKLVGFGEKMRARVQREFARMVAADTSLVKVSSSQQSLYMRFNNVATISLFQYHNVKDKNGETGISFRYAKDSIDGAGIAGDMSKVHFKTRAEAEQELARVQALLQAPKP